MPFKALVSLLDDNKEHNSLVENIENKKCFRFYDDNNCDNEYCIYDNGLVLIRSSEDYQIELHLYDDAYAKVVSQEGTIKIPVKILAFNSNDDIITIVYSIEGDKKRLKIEYL